MDIIRNPCVLTEDWNLLGNVYYRKFDLYDMEWDDEFNTFKKSTLSVGKLCGPIAKSFFIQSTKQTTIGIYTPSGRKISHIHWKGENIFNMFWTIDEELWVLTQFGKLSAYSIHGLLKYEIQLVNGHRVGEAKMVTPLKKNPCLAILTVQKNLILYPYINEKSDKALAFSFKDWINIPRCWDLLWIPAEPHPTIIVCSNTSSKYIYLFSENLSLKYELQLKSYYDEIIDMAISCNNKYISLVTNTNYLWIGSYDMNQSFAEINLSIHQHTTPRKIEWCGSGAVACLWENVIVLFGSQQDYHTYYIDTYSHLIADNGCLRIINKSYHHIIHEISTDLENIYLNSLHPGTLLFDAYSEYKKRSPKSLDLIEGIKMKLCEAVDACLKAAPEELIPSYQKLILNAALFGKSFTNTIDVNKFYQTCKLTQILNNLRNPSIGIPFTNDQFQKISPDFLIKKLKTRGYYGLAVEICTSLNYDKQLLNETILEWSYNKMIDSTISDDELAKLLLEKVNRYPSLSIISLGSLAITQNRKQLAIFLLDYVVDPNDHVPLLLELEQTQKALNIAIQSGDIDLVFIVIFYMRKNLSTTQFLMKIRSEPYLFGLCRRYYTETKNEKMLMSLYEQDDLIKYSACHSIRKSLAYPIIERIPHLNAIRKVVGSKSVIYNVLSETIKLYEMQKNLQKSLKFPNLNLIGLTLNQTLQSLLLKGYINDAEHIRREFYVPEIRFQWLVVDSLAKSHEWSKLQQFSHQKKPLIGYLPFAEACIEYHAPNREIEFYLPKIPIEDRTPIYLYLRKYELAADSAIASKNPTIIQSVLIKCNPTKDKTIYDKLDTALVLFK